MFLRVPKYAIVESYLKLPLYCPSYLSIRLYRAANHISSILVIIPFFFFSSLMTEPIRESAK